MSTVCAIAFPLSPRCVKRSYPVGNRPNSNYTSQIEAWQALLEKLAGNE
ncbi:MAG: hypothetical protein ICV55_02940 [Coleofasciculus sp. C3-bin4]|nr:hypothetical protein [Coleofasciculus sp. Co-bin14]MBD0361731.1 hypothetical protein [Coleofasciculus sp. C3-bin4]